MTSSAMAAAATGVAAQQLRVNTIANNVANINTDGFKRVDVSFADLFYITPNKAGSRENSEAAVRPIGVQIGLGTKVTGTYRNMELGKLKQTFHPLDIAITGPGYFAIALPNGKVGYTRAGNFHRDPETGNIVTAEGNSLTTAIAIPENIASEKLQISDSGLITASNPDNPVDIIEIGQLEIFTFRNEQGLEATGNNLLIETVASGEPVNVENTERLFKQGFMEGSNVNMVVALTELIEASQAREIAMRVISTQKEMDEKTANIG